MVNSPLATSNNTEFAPFWVPEPQGRGTWKIISSCLFTLSLCVFTAIHLNIGPHGQTTVAWWLHKCKWVAVAIVSPEIVLYSAGKQWFSAARLCKKLNSLALAETSGPELDPASVETSHNQAGAPTRRNPFRSSKKSRYSMMYGHYAVMGGFVVDVSHIHNSLSRLTISPKGIAFLARHGHFLEVPEAAIRDKSKADVLAKCLVCVQVSWMLVETIARKSVGYAITLLEIHTLFHVACTIGMYGLWFQKPLDVRDPTCIDPSEFQDMLALMLLRNYGFGSKARSHKGAAPIRICSTESSNSTGSESSYLHMYPVSNERSQQGVGPDKEVEGKVTLELRPRRSPGDPPNVITHHRADSVEFSLKPPLDTAPICSLVTGQSLPCGIGPALEVRPVSVPATDDNNGRLAISLSEKDIERWNLAAAALKRIDEQLHEHQGSVNYFTFHAPNIFLNRKGLKAGFYAYFCSWASGGLVAALVACSFYGAAHTLAWDFTFPTEVEQLLWQIACIDTMAGTISLLAAFSVAVYLHEHDFRSLMTVVLALEPGIMPWLYRAVILVGLLNLPLFLLSRVYIIVETAISLRYVPMGVYATVPWTQYIPHI